MCAVGAVCTAFYMFRSYYMTFYGRPPTEDHVKHVHESPRSMTWVLWFLAIGAVAISLIGSVFFVPAAIFHKTTWIESFLAPSTAAISDRFQGFWLDKEWMHNVTLEYGLMALSVVLAAIGIFGARFWYKDIAKTRDRMEWAKTNWRFIHRTVFNKYFVDEIYNATVVRGFMAISHGAVNGVADTVIGAGRRVRRVQSGRINAYVMGVAFGVVFLLFVVWFVGPQGR
jgi:NADH-quinone oxidoreductase subunit L